MVKEFLILIGMLFHKSAPAYSKLCLQHSRWHLGRDNASSEAFLVLYGCFDLCVFLHDNSKLIDP